VVNSQSWSLDCSSDSDSACGVTDDIDADDDADADAGADTDADAGDNDAVTTANGEVIGEKESTAVGDDVIIDIGSEDSNPRPDDSETEIDEDGRAMVLGYRHDAQ
jgi:hypothetical protein